MSYTFSGVAVDSNAGTTSTVSLDIGPTASPFVIVAVEQQNGHASPTLTVGGVPLNLDFINASSNEAFFSGVATGLSGAQNVALTAAGSNFETRSFSLWYTPTLVALSHTASVASANSFTIPVNAGDFLFAIGHNAAGAFTYANSTVAPSG